MTTINVLFRTLGLSLALWMGCQWAAASPVRSLEFQAPRPFGFVIGDDIRHRVVLDVDPAFTLAKAALPTPGPINRWLELRDIDVRSRRAGDSTRHVLSLRYQVFYAPLDVKMLAVPGFTLVLEGRGERFEQPVEPWHFTLSPIRELEVRKGEAGEYMRPDDPPAPLEKGAHRLRLALFSLLALTGLSAYLYAYGLLPFLARGQIFNRACRTLASLGRRGMNEAAYRQALTAVHRAFNALYGEPLFVGHLDDFFRQHPRFLAARAEIEAFFAASHGFLFAERGGMKDYPLERMVALCRHLRDLERGAA